MKPSFKVIWRVCIIAIVVAGLLAATIPWHRVAVWTLVWCLNGKSDEYSNPVCREIRADAALWLGRIGDDPKITIAVLLPHLQDKDEAIQNATAISLGHIHQYPEQVVPALLSSIETKPKSTFLDYRLIAIAKYGTNAQPWAPKLAQMIESNHFGIFSYVAVGVLKCIDPEKGAQMEQWLVASQSNNGVNQINMPALLAMLPTVSDFAKRMDLPLSLPITPAQVNRFNYTLQNTALWLTNNYWFVLENGKVRGFRSPDDWFTMAQEYWDHLERYVGKDNMTTNEAIELVRVSFRKLGYDPKDFGVDALPTQLQGSHDNQKLGHIPYCRIEWSSPQAANQEEFNRSYHIQFDIDMQTKQIVGMSLNGKKFFRPDPKIDVEPELESDYQKRMQGHMFIRTNAPIHLQPGQPPRLETNPPVQTNLIPPMKAE